MEDKILNRIKKMMALANDQAASDGERENALRMSYSLMAKHNLEMSDVEGRPIGPEEARKGVQGTFYGRPWATNVCMSVAKLFFCKYYFSRLNVKDQSRHTFTGKESNAVIAEEVARVLVQSIRQESNRRMRQEGQNATWRRSFATGAAFRISDRVRELLAGTNAIGLSTGTAMVLVGLHASEKKANELFVLSQGITLRTGASRASGNFLNDAYGQGRTYGSGLNLSTTKKLSTVTI